METWLSRRLSFREFADTAESRNQLMELTEEELLARPHLRAPTFTMDAPMAKRRRRAILLPAPICIPLNWQNSNESEMPAAPTEAIPPTLSTTFPPSDSETDATISAAETAFSLDRFDDSKLDSGVSQSQFSLQRLFRRSVATK